jgi:hypothetical protein
MSLSFFLQATVSDNTAVKSIINRQGIVDLISADSYFDTTGEIGSAIVYYMHQDGRQQKRSLHTFDGSNLSCAIMWSNVARDGTWQKTRLRVYDNDGAEHIIERADIGAGEDITHSAGIMTLNT